jgi:light-regulated signal transduction histidine kinase (bacteriophytochrome)
VVDQFGAFASEVTRVAREAGTDGKLGGQAEVEDVSGTWKDSTDDVNVTAGNLTMQVCNIAAERNGEQRHWLILKFPVNDASGRRLLGGLGVDITNAAQLQRSNVELQDFATAASHDLQEPLRKIRAFGDLLKHTSAEALGDEGRDYLDRMENAAARMQTLIQDLLQYSRVTTKARPFVPTDLAKTVLEVLSDLDIRIEQTGGRVEVAELPTVRADPLQMRELVQNLVGNALKFHRPGEPPLVRISARLLDPDGQPRAERETPQWCEISVADNGIGFEEKYAERIFDMFQRLHGRSQYEGSGIGLAICRKIVRRHGGRIIARSSPGQGATFLVTLPLCQSKMEGAVPCGDVPSLLRS